MIRSLESKFLYSFIVFDCLEQLITAPVYIGTVRGNSISLIYQSTG